MTASGLAFTSKNQADSTSSACLPSVPTTINIHSHFVFLARKSV